MKIFILHEIDSRLHAHNFKSMREAARVLGCDHRQLAKQLAKRKLETKTNTGTVVHIEARYDKTNSTPRSVREYTHQPEENSALGAMEIGRGWGRVEQAVVKVTTAVKWVIGKFHKPRDVV
jgi:hypothetical protein